jgi:hypothetical protein
VTPASTGGESARRRCCSYRLISLSAAEIVLRGVVPIADRSVKQTAADSRAEIRSVELPGRRRSGLSRAGLPGMTTALIRFTTNAASAAGRW